LRKFLSVFKKRVPVGRECKARRTFEFIQTFFKKILRFLPCKCPYRLKLPENESFSVFHIYAYHLNFFSKQPCFTASERRFPAADDAKFLWKLVGFVGESGPRP
jgi:hypothetical protein